LNVPALRYRFSPLAAADTRSILEESYRLFGALQQDRYFDLLMAAVERVAADPLGHGSRACDELGRGYRSFHIGHAARRRGAAAHVLFYRPATTADGETEVLIARVLHEHMDPERHIEG
jgi:toxin ParE1/3/4